MLKKLVTSACSQQPWRMITQRTNSSSVSTAVNSMILRSLKDHYLEVTKMAPPPKVSPPAEFSIVKGALDSNGPVLKRSYNNEEISISVMRLANFVSGEGDNVEEVDDDSGGGINQLFVHIDVSKPGMANSMHFLCGLYPDALGIHSVALRPKSSEDVFAVVPNKYTGPVFENLDDETRDAFHNYILERGINENLFPFLQAWLYVKDHRNLIRWFQSVGTIVSGREVTKGKDEAAAGAGEYKAAEGA